MSMPQRSACLSAAVFAVLAHIAPSWSFEDLKFYDDIRSSTRGDNIKEKLKMGSSVISITQGEDTQGSYNKRSYRLCHLASMLPLSDGNGKLTRHVNSAAAGLLSVLHFNNKDPRVVPELDRNPVMKNCTIKLTMESQDTEVSPITANRFLIENVSSRIHSLGTPRPCAIVGAARSAVSGPLSVMASVSDIPVVSFASTSSQLDNKDIYRLFGRTVPTDESRASAAVSYLRDVQGVTHCAVLYLRDEWGSAFQSAFTQAAFALEPPMKIVSASYDIHDEDGDEGSIRDAVERLKLTGFNYFFGIVSTPTYNTVMKVARREGIVGPGRFWLFGEILLGGTLGDHGVAAISLEIQKNDAFDRAWAELETASVKEYFISKQPKNLDFNEFKFFHTPHHRQYLEYDSVMALGFAACHAKEEFFTGGALFDAFTKTSFTGASGWVSFNPQTGTRDASQLSYKVSNIVADRAGGQNNVTYMSIDVARQVRVASETTNFTMKWMTIRQTNYADGSHMAPPILPQKEEITNMISSGAVIFGLILSGLVMTLSLVSGSWTVLNRNTRVVCSSQPQFLLMLCGGTFIAASSIVPLSLQEPTSQQVLDIACMSVPWLFSLGWVISFSALFSKTLRIYKLLKKSQSFCRITIKPKDVLKPFLSLFTCNLIVLISWTLVAPRKWQRLDVTSSVDSFGRMTESYATCAPDGDKSELPFVVLLLLLDVGCLLYALHVSYRARNIATEYHETYYLAMCVASIAQAFVVSVPVLAVLCKPTPNFVIRAILVTIVCATFLIPLFVPKIQATRMEKEERKLRSSLKKETERRLTLSTRNKEIKDELRTIVTTRTRDRPSFTDTSVSTKDTGSSSSLVVDSPPRQFPAV